jgi:hypothetical protein
LHTHLFMMLHNLFRQAFRNDIKLQQLLPNLQGSINRKVSKCKQEYSFINNGNSGKQPLINANPYKRFLQIWPWLKTVRNQDNVSLQTSNKLHQEYISRVYLVVKIPLINTFIGNMFQHMSNRIKVLFNKTVHISIQSIVETPCT